MFFFQKWLIRSEPFFFLVLWGKLTILTCFGSEVTHGYLYTPPALLCWSSFFSLSYFLSRHQLALRDFDLKQGVISSKQFNLRHLSQPHFWPRNLKSLFGPKLWQNWDFDILLTKQPLFKTTFLTKLAFFDPLQHSMGKYRWKSLFLRNVTISS